MSKKLSLSVIIPTYNRSQLVQRAIKSVLNQNIFMPLEIIVLDDASTDDTIKVMNDFETHPEVSIVFYKSIFNVGPSKLRNIGIQMAQGEYVAFLDSDDVWTENKLNVFASALEALPDIKIWTHKYGNLGDREHLAQDFEIIPYWKQLLKNHASCPCTIIRKDLNQKFSEDLKYNEDHELFTRISFSHQIIKNNSILTLLNRGINEQGGLSGNVWNMRQGEMKTYIKSASYNPKMIFVIPFLLLFSLSKHARLILRSL